MDKEAFRNRMMSGSVFSAMIDQPSIPLPRDLYDRMGVAGVTTGEIVKLIGLALDGKVMIKQGDYDANFAG